MLDYYVGGPLSGFEFIESREMVDRVTKVYKTTRKWKKHGIKRETIVTPKKDVMVMGNRIIGHPAAISEIKRRLINSLRFV